MSESEDETLNDSVIESRKIKDYIKKRGILKGRLTLFKRYITNLKSSRQPLSAEQLLDIELRLEKISDIYNVFECVQDSIETLSVEVEPQVIERESFENTYYECVSFAKGCLKKAGASSNPNLREENVPVPSESVKYPDITLPSFSGDIINWIEFRDSFDALVNQTNLKPIQKFKYLRSSVTGGALEVISSLEYSEESYSIAWQLLCERYNNPKVLVNNHLRALFHIETVPTQSHALRSLADNISKHLRTLKSLSISIEHWDLLVIFFLVSKLEAPLQRKWEEKTNSREIPTLQDFKSFLRAQADLHESLSRTGGGQTERHASTSRKALVITSSPPQPNSKVTIPRYNNRSQCPFCNGGHYINQCPNFLAQNVTSRIRTTKRLGLCLNCLGSNHIVPNCRASHCRTCKGKHHTLLHITQPHSTPHISQPSTMPRAEPNPLPESKTVNLLTNFQLSNNPPSQTDGKIPSGGKFVILSTARVTVFDNDNNSCILKALLDSGSQSNYLTETAVNKLNLPTRKIDMEVIGFNENVTKINQLCDLSLQSNDKKFSTKISCFIVPNICSLPPQAIDPQSLNIPKRFKLADESFLEGGEVDLILGAELFYQLMCIGQHRLGQGLPVLQRTKLGWVVSGAITTVNKSRQVRCNFISNRDLKCVWDEDDLHKPVPNDDSIPCEKIFSTHTRTSDGKFVVSLPLKEPVASLGLSRPIVYRRFITLEAKFARNPEFKDKYVDFMKEFKDSGHMIKTKETDDCNFLPQHAILNPFKATTPLRVVMDASFKTTTGRSLNDIQYKGTINQDDLVNILLRFRTRKYIVIADIEKMYRMIYINPDQRNLQCILWRDNPNEPLITYQLTTLSFGLKCAPYLATRCLLQLADEHKNRFPRASNAITKDFYMDDFIYGGDDENQVSETAVQVNQILSSAKFNLRKWKSNSTNILNAVTNQNNKQTQHTPTTLGPETQKVLGLAWCSDGDYLMYTLKREPVPKHLTKRKILSITSAIFDPLGLLGPVLIVAKIFIQRLWKNKSDWDDIISNELSNEWLTFYKKLPILNSLSLPRYALNEDYVIIELHGFADSSLTAYGAAIYMRCIDKCGGITVRLLCSKNRLARNETIPKLELRAASLLTTLHNKVNNALTCTIQNRYFWSDSNVALSWIRSKPEKLNCFIKNRVTEIQKLSNITDWLWVPSSENPADLLTRGVSADKLEHCKLWWEGPSWLKKSSVHWPSQQIPTTTQALRNDDMAESNETFCNVYVNIQPNLFMTNLFKRWSSLIKLNHCFAFILRFIQNCKNGNNRIVGPLTLSELNEALNKLIKFSQSESFPNEYRLLRDKKPISSSSKLINLNPYMENGIIRVGGRLGRSYYNHEKKHPIILPKNHDFTYLIVRSEHVRLLHAGPQLLLSSIRERFWPIHGRKVVNKVVQKCVTCFRAKPSLTTPIMGNLPPSRVTPSPPFQTTNVDYAGPFIIRDRRGRGYKTNKCYIAVFVCSSTKAVHIELVSGLDTFSFLSAYRRFISRRGRPREMLSDNGTNFHGANNEITELYKYLRENSNELITSFAEEGIAWKFIPVSAPHMGGLHESAVKSCKFHLKRTLGHALLTYEEFATILTQIEGILNSRPLCPISNSSIDNFDILTPAHFLVGRTPVSMPDYDYTDVPANRLTHYQQLQQLQQGFWRRWSRDYVGQLQERTKWRSCKGQELRVGTMVVVREDRTPPCLWRLGRIVGCCQGRDGVTRVAEIQTARGSIKRAFNNICPLPINGID